MADLTAEELAAEFASSPGRVRQSLSAAMWGIGVTVAREQRRDLAAGPYRSSIARSIKATGEDGMSFTPGVDMTVEVGPESPLAPIVEFGTRNNPPRPFVFQAVDRIEAVIVRDVADAVDL